MYQPKFGMNGRPFVAAPMTTRYFPARAIEHVRQTLARTIERAEGPGLLIGAAGTGKTLVCLLLAEQFRALFRVVKLVNAHLSTPRELWQNILYELGRPYRDMDEGELRLSTIDHLSDPEFCPNGVLLLVDEAHALPPRLLDELRQLTNLVRDGLPRVRLILAGLERLEEKFASPRLHSFNQRIAARCYLDSFSRDETLGYIRAQILRVGGEPTRIFVEEALNAVHDATDGTPRLINQLCDHALMMATVCDQGRVDAATIHEAWADLQQLPTPWGKSDDVLPFASGKSEASSIIEFGPLEPARSTAMSVEITTKGPAWMDDIDTGRQLDQIVRQVDEVASDGPPSAPEAVSAHSGPILQPGVEIVFPDRMDCMQELFDEEEVVIDRYAALDADLLRRRPQVSDQESREIAAALAVLLRERGHSNSFVAGPSTLPLSSDDVPVPSDVSFDPAEDPDDDRDLIIVEDNGGGNLVRKPVRDPRKQPAQKYHQLFAKLRRG